MPFALSYSYSTISHQTKFELRRLIERLLYSMLCAAVRAPCCLANPLESRFGPWVLRTVQRKRVRVGPPLAPGGVWSISTTTTTCGWVGLDEIIKGHKYAYVRSFGTVPGSAGRPPPPFTPPRVSHCTPAIAFKYNLHMACLSCLAIEPFY